MISEVVNAVLTFRSDATQIENGGFAEYIVAKGDVQIKTPDNITDEDAATLGISIATVVNIRLSPRIALH